MKSTLTGAEVVDLIMRGAQLDERYLPSSVNAPAVSGLPTGSPTIYQLDAYGSMQLLSFEHADTPICGVDVVMGTEDDEPVLIVARETSQLFAITDETYTGAAFAAPSVAPGGRTIAVSLTGGTRATRFVSHTGSIERTLVDTSRVVFLERDTAFYTFNADSVRVGAAGNWFTRAASGSWISDIEVAPTGDAIVYATQEVLLPGSCTVSERVTTIWEQAYQQSPVAVRTIPECSDEATEEVALRYSEFGDAVASIRTLYNENLDQTEHHSFWQPLSGSEVTLATWIDPLEVFFGGQAPGVQALRVYVDEDESTPCEAETRQITSGGALITARTLATGFQCGEPSEPILAPRRRPSAAEN
jgi:hypothetical protein